MKRAYINGNILGAGKPASALLVEDKRIVFVGGDDTINIPGAVDLKGRTVVPGLIEGHMHALGLGRMRKRINGFMRSKAEVVADVRDACRLNPNAWVLGWGWNHENWDGVWPSKRDLDLIAPHTPVYLRRADGHSAWANSETLKRAGIKDDVPDPFGGEFLRDEAGHLTGIVIDTAMSLIDLVVPEDTYCERISAYQAMQDELLSYGFTSYVDAGVNYRDAKEIEQANLALRAYLMLQSGAEIDFLADNRTPFIGEKVSINCVKILADGSLGSRSAYLSEPYADRPGAFGQPIYDQNALNAAVKRATDAGFKVAVHAIGDATIDMVMDAFDRAPGQRMRIEHFQITRPGMFSRAARAGYIPSMQPIHYASDADMAKRRLGQVRFERAYDLRGAIDTCGLVVFGSDAPVEPVNPFLGMQAALKKGVTCAEALKGYTSWAAYAQFEDHVKGTLAPGMYADFAILNRDIMTCDVSTLPETRALATVIGGELVYGSYE